MQNIDDDQPLKYAVVSNIGLQPPLLADPISTTTSRIGGG